MSQSNPSSHGNPAKEEPTSALKHDEAEPEQDIEEAPVDIDVLQNLNPTELNRILDENKEAIIAGDNRNKRLLTNKKMFSETSHHNSEDFKELGNLHKDKRSVEYYPSDGKHNFESKP